MDDRNIEERIEKTVRIYRIVGWVLICGGGFAVACFAFVAFTAVDAPRSLGSKLGSVAGVGLLPIIGVVFVFNPKEKIASSLRRVMTIGRQ
jgi:hypothetical protein